MTGPSVVWQDLPGFPEWVFDSVPVSEIGAALDRLTDGHVLVIEKTIAVPPQLRPVRFEDMPAAWRDFLAHCRPPATLKPWPLRLVLCVADGRIENAHELKAQGGRSVA